MGYDLVCLSHLRWGFVYQRPQHLMTRFARERRVLYVEEPMLDDGPPRMALYEPAPGVSLACPHLPHGLDPSESERQQAALLDALLAERRLDDYVLWYYTPMALGVTSRLAPLATVYDCMDELSGFLGAPPELREREEELFRRADLVFTGGRSLYEAKRRRHPSVHLFPSSVDSAHFGRARRGATEPPDQAPIARPRLGYCGVIDERMDLQLIAAVADARPDWQLVMLGPVVKIDQARLPRRANIHYVGGKPYPELPDYLGGWDVALMPFALNDATRYISPTKTPEYLAAGLPVVSTPIRDVVSPYGERGLARIAATAEEFVAAALAAMAEDAAERARRSDAFLAGMSWDRTADEMAELIGSVVAQRRVRAAS